MGNILWSWHLWFTYEPSAQVYYNGAGRMMDRNLGATYFYLSPGDVGALGLLYQWGRKDPFLNSMYIDKSTEAQSTITWPSAVPSDSIYGTIEYATANPTTFITDESDWYKGGSARWTTSETGKSIYDPCPAGWRVPDGGENGVWQKAVGSGSSIIRDYPCDATNKGVDFSGTFGAGKTNLLTTPISYPAAGFRDNTTGRIFSVGQTCQEWSSSLLGDKAYYMYFRLYADTQTANVSLSQSSDGSPCARGCSVRCVKE